MPSIDMDVNEKADDSSKVASSEFSDKEHEILNKQLQIPEVAVGYAALYRFASREETAILFFCSVLAAGAGVVMPLMTVCAEPTFSASSLNCETDWKDHFWTICGFILTLSFGRNHDLSLQSPDQRICGLLPLSR